MAKGKELSERELAALGGIIRALDDAAEEPVYPSFIRRFTTKEETRNGLKSCTVHAMFGFRRVESDDGGIGMATVRLRETLVADRVKLAHTYFVWVPEFIHLAIREGADLVRERRRVLSFPLGNGAQPFVTLVSRTKGAGKRR